MVFLLIRRFLIVSLFLTIIPAFIRLSITIGLSVWLSAATTAILIAITATATTELTLHASHLSRRASAPSH